MPTGTTYTFSDAQRLTGVQRGHLARWAERGVITADLGGGGISGAHRKFSFRNIFEIALAVELQRFRIEQRFVEEVLNHLRMLDPDTVEDAVEAHNRRVRQDPFLRGKGHLLDPASTVRLVKKHAGSADPDTDLYRWNRFKNPDTRGDALAFLVVTLEDYSGHLYPAVNFVTDLRLIEEIARDRTEIIAHLPPSSPHFEKISELGITNVVIDAKRVLMRLEKQTGDRL